MCVGLSQTPVMRLCCSAHVHLLLQCMPLESTACLLLPHEREALRLAYHPCCLLLLRAAAATT